MRLWKARRLLRAFGKASLELGTQLVIVAVLLGFVGGTLYLLGWVGFFVLLLFSLLAWGTFVRYVDGQ